LSFSHQIDVLCKDTSRRIEDLVFPQYLRFNVGVLFPAMAPENGRRWPKGINHSHHPVGAASSYLPPRLQLPIAGKVWRKYTLDISRLLKVLRSLQRSP
jgi:hypothetical protein